MCLHENKAEYGKIKTKKRLYWKQKCNNFFLKLSNKIAQKKGIRKGY